MSDEKEGMRDEARADSQALVGDAAVKWRWLLLDYVDPELNLSRAERRKVRRQVRANASRGRHPFR